MKKGIFICLLFVGKFLFAQDVHFSHWTQNPIHLSPSFAGDFDGKHRFSFQKRGQWASVSIPFNTTSIGFDMPYKSFGLAAQLLLDQAGSSQLSNSQFNVSVSKSFLGWRLGTQLGFARRQIDYSELEFIDSETVPSLTSNYLDVSLGFSKDIFLASDKKLLAGYSLFHLNSPNRAFLNQDDLLSARHQVFTILDLNVVEDWLFQPTLMWMRQSSQQEFQLGADVLFDASNYFSQDLAFKTGTQFRLGDAIGISLGIRLNKTDVAFHYEWNVSDLAPASNNLGAWEVSLIHVISAAPRKKPKLNYCPSYL